MLKEVAPPNLLKDPIIKALLESTDPELQKVKEQIINVIIYPRIDEIDDEELLDLLAWQFHVEGYELARTIDEKRNLVKNSIELHRYKGTKYAVEKVLSTLNLGGKVKEWFEYGGNPYRFKIDLFFEELIKHGITLTPQVQDRLIELINSYKNERSHLEELKFNVFFENEQKTAASSKVSTFTKASLKEDTEKKILMSQDGEYRIFGTGIKPVSFTKTALEEETEKRLSLENGVSIFSTAKAAGVLKASLESVETEWSFSSSCAVSGSFNSLAFLRINLTGGIN
ncbi:phage tail protein, P2 protein I family [Balnearium lithotrophicum]|uniref:Phage tail protein, P2 protein I family n=1 Tax=Balnearium lithotrophicum TaxID=223788 RepID=A0A521DS05_9BACT|nr:phage tail protein I [Balnearium lithotrophicum]SMO74487.1 phage tail protein, P2 protein I family [Balnearium lithotrophicum]